MTNTVAYGTNRILRNTTTIVPLKYLSNSWRSLEIPLINNKVELKHKWTKHCVLPAASGDNTNSNPDNITFTIKDTKLFVPIVTLLAKDNQKLLKLLSKGLEKSMYWYEYKAKSVNKNMTKKYRYFLETNFVEVTKF